MFAIAAAVFSISCLHLVTSLCPQHCETCSDTNQCLTCKFGRWGIYVSCTYTCSNNCTDSDCDDKGYCYSCLNGMYGPKCNQNCQLCKDGECGLRECTSGCKIGYYQYISGDYSYCYPCPDNCQQCQNFTYCTLCDTGYYISRYTQNIVPQRGISTCTICQLNNLCDECSKLSNCLQCSTDAVQLQNVTCEHCVEGYTLDNHQCVNNITCSPFCLTGCTLIGECIGCRDDRTGSRCTYRCSSMCATCLQTNQNICLSCNNGFFSNTCTVPCPPNCAGVQCDFSGGNCLNGCLAKFWGDKCENNCSDHCTQSECNRDGTCLHGCTAAYDGLHCNITTTTTKTMELTSSSTSGLVPSNTRSQSYSTTIKTTVLSLSSSSEIGVSTVCNCQDDRSSSFGPVIGGAVTGAVLITALLVGSIAYFLHRRTVSRPSNIEQRTDTMYYNTVGRSSVYEEAGQNINKASKLGTIQTPDISVYDQLSRTNTEHVYTGL